MTVYLVFSDKLLQTNELESKLRARAFLADDFDKAAFDLYPERWMVRREIPKYVAHTYVDDDLMAHDLFVLTDSDLIFNQFRIARKNGFIASLEVLVFDGEQFYHMVSDRYGYLDHWAELLNTFEQQLGQLL